MSEHHSERGATEGKQQAFGEQLPDEPRPSGPESHADRDFPLPRRSSRQQQVRDIGAGDEQHHADHNHQDQQRQTILRANPGDAVRSGCRVKRTRQIFRLLIGMQKIRRQRGFEDFRSQCIQARRYLGCGDPVSADR